MNNNSSYLSNSSFSLNTQSFAEHYLKLSGDAVIKLLISLLIATCISIGVIIIYIRSKSTQKLVWKPFPRTQSTLQSAPASRRTSEHADNELKLRRSKSYGSLNEQLTMNMELSSYSISAISNADYSLTHGRAEKKDNNFFMPNDCIDKPVVNECTVDGVKSAERKKIKKFSIDSSENEDDILNYITKSCRLWLTLYYDKDAEILTVKIIQVINIPPRDITADDENGLRDCFIKIYLLPEERLLNQTKIFRKSLNPKYCEKFNFSIRLNELEKKSLRFTIYDVNKRKLRFTVGHSIVGPLANLNLSTQLTQYFDVKNFINDSKELGELCVSLSHHPNSNRLKLCVLASKNVRKFYCEGTTSTNYNVHLKITLVADHKIKQALQSETRLGLLDQDFNEEFDIEFNMDNIHEISIIVAYIIHSKNTFEQEYGRVTFGNKYTIMDTDEINHWNDALTNTGKTITRLHKLKSPYKTN